MLMCKAHNCRVVHNVGNIDRRQISASRRQFVSHTNKFRYNDQHKSMSSCSISRLLDVESSKIFSTANLLVSLDVPWSPFTKCFLGKKTSLRMLGVPVQLSGAQGPNNEVRSWALNCLQLFIPGRHGWYVRAKQVLKIIQWWLSMEVSSPPAVRCDT